MNIEDAKGFKKELEETLLELIEDFEEATDVVVTGISIKRAQEMTREKRGEVYQVEVTIKL